MKKLTVDVFNAEQVLPFPDRDMEGYSQLVLTVDSLRNHAFGRFNYHRRTWHTTVYDSKMRESVGIEYWMYLPEPWSI